MSFLNASLIGWAAAITIPPLIALYFLKLKRTVHSIPSTILWKRAIEDLHVNSPFQRLRSSLLLLLQLLILILAAVALGKPMLEVAETHQENVVLLIDQSASMSVLEEGNRTRLDMAKEEAKKRVDNLGDDARAMVIALCDRATVISSFDTDKEALKRKIDNIQQTQSTTTLAEAIRLAEANAQNIIIGRQEGSPDLPPERNVSIAEVFLLTDGRISDADEVALKEIPAEKLVVRKIGDRGDNVGIISLQARRNYEQPEKLEVIAVVRNFGEQERQFDAVLYLNGSTRDIQSVRLAPGAQAEAADGQSSDAPPPGSVAIFEFDEEFSGSGVIEVSLRIDDALSADNRAWTVIAEPRHVKVLLVTEGNIFLEELLPHLPLIYEKMSPDEYEEADDEKLLDGRRSAYDVVILDGHSTDRLPQGNYLFWGAIPLIEGVAADETLIADEIFFNWDDTHPILRYVAAETIFVYRWLRLELPDDAVSIIDGQTSPVMSYFSRDASQFLISAFRLIEDEDGEPLMNTLWPTQPDFVIFMYNTVQFLASNVETTGEKSVSPGQPVTLPVPEGVSEVSVLLPDNSTVIIPVTGFQTVHFSQTRQVGAYHVSPAVTGHDVFAVNLFDAVESRVKPLTRLNIGTDSVVATSGAIQVNKPAWFYFLLAMLLVLIVEWVIYNLRVFV